MFKWPFSTDMKRETKDNISEPIYSFVECVKSNHRRFTLTRYNDIYYLYDKILGKKYVCGYSSNFGREGFHILGIDWITEDEEDYIKDKLVPFYKERASRLQMLKNHRERRYYLKMYCK